jgi:hypothetical protein
MTHPAARSWWPQWLPGPFLGLVLLAVSTGCGRRGLDGLVPVAGQVTFAGGSCPNVGYLYFVPAAAGGGRAGSATFDRDGEFAVTTVVPGDGLRPGEYLVRLQCWETVPDDSGQGGKSHVPAGFEPPRLTVTAGSGGQRYSFDVPGNAAHSRPGHRVLGRLGGSGHMAATARER